MYRFAFGLSAAALAAGCSLVVSTDGLFTPPSTAIPSEGGVAEAGVAEAGVAEAGDSGAPDGATSDPSCPFPHGVSTTAAWAIRGGCVARNGRARVVGPDSAAKLRTFKMKVTRTDEYAISGNVAITADGTFIIGAEDQDHGVRAYSDTGVLVWESTTPNSDGTTIGADGLLYSATGQGISSLQPRTGSRRWETLRRTEIDTSLALASNGDLFYGTFDGFVGALTKDGAERWSKNIGNKDDRVYPIALGPTGVVYVASQNDALLALDPTTGDTLWTYPLESDAYDMPSVDDAGNIYVGTVASALHSVDPSGTRRWRLDLASGGVNTPSIARDGTVYATSEGGKLRALDPKNGNELWSRDMPKGAVGQPLVDAEGTLYVATREPQLRVFAADGTPRFNVELGARVGYTPALGPTGSLVVALGTGEVRIFDR